MACSFDQPFGCPAEGLDKIQDAAVGAVGSAASGVANGAIERFAEAVATGVGDAVQSMTTMWVRVPNPKLAEGGEGTAAWLSSHLWWYMSAAAVLSVIIAGARMAWSSRGSEPLMEGLRSLITLAFVSGAGIAVINVALQAGDAYSTWILQGAGGDEFGKRVLVMLTALTQFGAIGVILVIVLGLLVIVTAIAQIVLMVARSATLVILAGMWPLSAAATNTAWGQQWFKKTSGWIVAMVLYKPAAATIYAAALHMFGNEKGLLGALMGLTAMTLALVAMPALMRLCVPLVGGLSGGAASGGSMAAMGVAAGLAARGAGSGSGPTGAIPITPMPPGAATGGGPGGGGGGTSGPSGSGNPGGTPPAAPTRPTGAPASPAASTSGGGAAASGGAAKGAAGVGAAAGGPAGLAVMAGAAAIGAGAEGAKRVARDATAEGGDL